ncbi:MAG: DUF2891 domain-containing protein [Rudaea sp.]
MTLERPALTPETAQRLAALALANIAREYPHKLDHVLTCDEDCVPPRTLHPAFHGSYDWHSCVHMHWLLARLARGFPDLPARTAIEALFDRHFAPAAIVAELDYLARPQSASFERTYGWAWLLALAAELRVPGGAKRRRWSDAIAPLADAFAARYRAFLPRATYAFRYGIHPNSAFALALALDYARSAGDTSLGDACTAKALSWFGDERDAPARFEPSGVDFLSPSLIEADLMRRLLDAQAFAEWLAAFLPGFGAGEPHTLFEPAQVVARDDPQLVHLDGLNLSRAWCFRGIAGALPRADPRIAIARMAAERHLAAGWRGLANEDFAGAHWLATFAVLALAG